jgi:uncharacterized membrane protein YdjX (TVP38/TMEM64 family)
MSDEGNNPNRRFLTLLGGVVMINLLFYWIAWYVELDKHNFLPFVLQEGNWIYGVIVVPVICLVFSLVEVAITRQRPGWVGWFLIGCLILSFAAANGVFYFFGGWLYA